MTSDDLPTSDDPVVARLRSALDELTDGAAPNETRVASLSARRTRKWLLPAVAAAAVAVIVGVAVAVVGRDDGTTPIAPTPTGPPIGAVGSIPWYELQLDDDTVGSEPADVSLEGDVPQVWAAPDYSRVLVAFVDNDPNASVTPDDWPVVEALPDVPVGVAWAFSGDDPTATWHGIYWAPDDNTGVVLSGFGFTPEDLAAVLPALRVEPGPIVVSALSSLVPLPSGPDSAIYSSSYPLPGNTEEDPLRAFISVSPGGASRPLSLWAPGATSTAPVSTPFGDGFRAEWGTTTAPQTFVWWQVDDGPYWAGFSAPADQFDELFARVTRVEDIPTPGPQQPPRPLELPPTTTSPPAPCTDPPEVPTSTTAAGAHSVSPPELPTTTTTTTTCIPTGDGAPASTTTSTTIDPSDISTTSTAPPVLVVATTSSAGPVGPEPPMTALVPPSFPGEAGLG